MTREERPAGRTEPVGADASSTGDEQRAPCACRVGKSGGRSMFSHGTVCAQILIRSGYLISRISGLASRLRCRWRRPGRSRSARPRRQRLRCSGRKSTRTTFGIAESWAPARYKYHLPSGTLTDAGDCSEKASAPRRPSE